MESRKKAIKTRLKLHVDYLEKHFKNASGFLVKCQIVEPYVKKGILQGSVCPWEIGVGETSGFTILEDFHDTLEAMWVWCYYTKISKKVNYKPNIKMGWNYVTANFERFIPPHKENEGLYDCSQIILGSSLYEKVFSDKSYHKWLEIAGNRLAHYLSKIQSAQERGYLDPWWMATCLASAAQILDQREWLEVAKNLVKRGVIEKETPFSRVEKEPPHRGAGDHDFFSHNANKVLALLSCFPRKAIVKEILVRKFLPLAPRRFVKRHVDANPWNANVAAALGRSYLLTGEDKFLQRYFLIMDELRKRDIRNSSALPRSEKFPLRESWVTFFYAYAYASVIM